MNARSSSSSDFSHQWRALPIFLCIPFVFRCNPESNSVIPQKLLNVKHHYITPNDQRQESPPLMMSRLEPE